MGEAKEICGRVHSRRKLTPPPAVATVAPVTDWADSFAISSSSRRTRSHKQPFRIGLADGKPLAFAGLWERWQGPQGPVESCAILTTGANELMRPIHDRMPVILGPRDFEGWLDPAGQDPAALAPLLRPYPAEGMRSFPVGRWVNDPCHEGPKCLEPLADRDAP